MIFTKNPKKKHYLSKIELHQKKIWDLEFLRDQQKAIRESFRQEYDKINESMDAATARLEVEKQKEDPDKTIVENMENLIKRITPDSAQLKTQMEAIDTQIEGNGGINDLIDKQRMVIHLLQESIRKI